MAKHTRMNVRTRRRFATAAIAAASITALTPGVAGAAEVVVPDTDIRVEIPGIENVEGIENIPGISQWIPSLEGQSTVSAQDIQSAIDRVKALPGSSAVPGLNEFLNEAETIAMDAFNVSAPAPQAFTATAGVAATPAPAPAPAAAPASTGQAIVDAARSKTGAPYAWGGSGPNSFDCSGLTSWAYAQVGKEIPRTSGAQAAQGQNVPLDQLQPGDIVAYYGGASHVGIYTGNGTIIDALNSSSPVQERSLHYMPIHSAVRF